MEAWIRRKIVRWLAPFIGSELAPHIIREIDARSAAAAAAVAEQVKAVEGSLSAAVAALSQQTAADLARLASDLAQKHYLPHCGIQSAWCLSAEPDQPMQRDEDGLPIPPQHLLEAYSPSVEDYLAAGRHHIPAMLDALSADGFVLPSTSRILDFGCGVARLIRSLSAYARTGEVWGVDISASHIHWCNQYLWPPFHFATTTLVPHLPFPDGYFDLIYAGSVFTHIEDLADAWLLELRRVLAPGGCAFLTYHDEHSIDLLLNIDANSHLRQQLLESPAFIDHRENYRMISIGRGRFSQVFVRRDFLLERFKCSGFQVRGAHEAIWGYQTGYVVTTSTTPRTISRY